MQFTPRPVPKEEAKRRFQEIRDGLTTKDLPPDTEKVETMGVDDSILKTIERIEKRRSEDPAYDKKVREAQESVDGPETP